jgi:hypothetical protein
VSSREKLLVESRVNSFALFSVLRAGRVRKFEKCMSYGDRSKKFEVIRSSRTFKNWGQVKKMGWARIGELGTGQKICSGTAQISHGDRPKKEDMGTGPMVQSSMLPGLKI